MPVALAGDYWRRTAPRQLRAGGSLLAGIGFWIERLTEPRPLPEAAAIDPRHYERLCREPTGFLAFRLRPQT